MRSLLLLSSILSLSIAATTTANASGYGIKVNSTILQGRANAGSGVDSDIFAMYNNPAILSQLGSKYEAAINGTSILPHVKYNDFLNNNTSTSNVAQSRFTGGAAFAAKLHPCVTVGLSVTTPFGLAFSYPNTATSPVRNYVVQSDMKAVAISPTIAFKVNPMLTLGVGVDAQWTEVKFSSYPTQAFPTMLGTAKGNAWVARGTFGVLVEPTKDLRLGVSVKTRATSKLKGDFTATNPQPVPAFSGKASADLPLPTTISFSASYNVTPKWTVYGDFIRTNWSAVNAVVLRNPIRDRTLVGDWKDSNFFSIGTDYKLAEQWTVRGGLGFDKTPTTTTIETPDSPPSRIPGIPDSNKIWLAIGGSYEVKCVKFSLSYGHEFFKNARIEQNAVPALGRPALSGQVKEHVDLISLQINYKF
jgi:long-chain fatty acid transport protein